MVLLVRPKHGQFLILNFEATKWEKALCSLACTKLTNMRFRNILLVFFSLSVSGQPVFDVNNVVVGEQTSSPFQWTGDNELFRFHKGKKTIKLVATDDAGGTSSATISIKVEDVF